MNLFTFGSLTLCALLVSCGGGQSRSVQQTADGYQIDSGLAQKGPLGRGSVVTLNELDASLLAPNGKSYTYETQDNFGTFAPTSKFSSPYLETTAQGYYFNELTGEQQKDWVALRGLSNLSAGADRAVNVNVLSNFTKERIRVLVKGKVPMAFNAARAQAQRELLNALGIFSGSDVFSGTATTPGSFMELDLGQSRQADQILAAISGLVTYIGQTGGGVNVFLNQVETDLADDGLLNNSPNFASSVQQQFSRAAANADLGKVAANLNGFYALKTPYQAADLRQWIDSSGGVDQVIDKYKYTAFNVKPGVLSLSTPWVAGADDVGQCFYASGDVSYKNGIKLSGAAVAAKGDKFALGITPASAGVTVTRYLQRSAASTPGNCAGVGSMPTVRVLKYVVTAAPMPASSLGANLPAISDYSYTPVYADLVNQSRRFGPPTHPWGGSADTVAVGGDGWPVGDFGLFLMTRPGLAGTYKMSFSGRADVSLTASRDTTLANLRYDAATNRTTGDVVRGADGAQMVLVFTNTGSGIKNLKVVRPGYDALDPPLFTTEFVNHIERFKTVRFMDWLRTNGNETATWADRATLGTHHASDAGVPWEHIVSLANHTKKDIWINIPVRADDNYVLQLAKLFKATLNAGSKVYVEYSNEIWNPSFTQHGVNIDLAKAELQANPQSTLAYDGSTDANKLGFRRVAQRGKEIGDIFRTVYGDSAMMTTVRPVFASQVVQTYVAQVGLDFINALYGSPARYFYALAGAPYYNMGSLQQVDGLSTDEVLKAMDGSINALPEVNHFEKNMALARWYSLPFLAYEGGSDTFGKGSIAAKKAASLDPRMLNLCTRYLHTWYAYGGEMFMWFTAGAGNWDTQYGTWELTPDMALTNTPKIQCIDTVRAGVLPALKGRNMAPGSFNALAYVGNPEPYSEASKTGLRYLHPGSYVDYLVLAPAVGSYQLRIIAEAERTGNTIDVLLNASRIAEAFELKATGWGKPGENAPISLNLPQGFSTLRIQTKSENLGFLMSTLTLIATGGGR